MFLHEFWNWICTLLVSSLWCYVATQAQSSNDPSSTNLRLLSIHPSIHQLTGPTQPLMPKAPTSASTSSSTTTTIRTKTTCRSINLSKYIRYFVQERNITNSENIFQVITQIGLENTSSHKGIIVFYLRLYSVYLRHIRVMPDSLERTIIIKWNCCLW